MERIGLRAAGRLAGCDHAHIKRLADAGRLRRGEDGLFDPADVLEAMAQADPGFVRKEPSKGGDPMVTTPAKSPPRRQSPPRPVTASPARDEPAPEPSRLGYLAPIAAFGDPAHRGAVTLALFVAHEVAAIGGCLALDMGAPVEAAFGVERVLGIALIETMEEFLARLGVQTESLVYTPAAMSKVDWEAVARRAGLTFDRSVCEAWTARRLADLNARAEG